MAIKDKPASKGRMASHLSSGTAGSVIFGVTVGLAFGVWIWVGSAVGVEVIVGVGLVVEIGKGSGSDEPL